MQHRNDDYHCRTDFTDFWLFLFSVAARFFFLVLVSFIFSSRCRAVDQAGYLSAFERLLIYSCQIVSQKLRSGVITAENNETKLGYFSPDEYTIK